MIRLLHTSDWHLGRVLHGVNLLEDQQYLLEQLVDVVCEERPDAVLVAGDVYDRAVPAPDAVALLDETLSTIVGRLGTQVVLIAGNHDSPDRLAFGARLLAGKGLHLFGRLTDERRPLVLRDEHGPLEIHALPYAEPTTVRHVLGDETLTSHEKAMGALTARILEGTETRRRVLVAHAFVSGGRVGDTERPLSVGGTGTVNAASFSGFMYTALGHLHRPQRSGEDSVQYAGSLFPYSFSEADHAKSVTLVDLGKTGIEGLQRVPLRPRRPLRAIEGQLGQLVAKQEETGRDDFLLVTLTDSGPVFDAIGKLRERYPNVLHVVRKELQRRPRPQRATVDKTISDHDLFARFFEDVTGDELGPAASQVLEEMLQSVQIQQRESAS